MEEDFSPSTVGKAKEMGLFIGDYLFDSGETPEIQMNASAIAHASICFTYGLDIHKTLESVMHMYKQMEERLGKA
jgi:hypothetical protein